MHAAHAALSPMLWSTPSTVCLQRRGVCIGRPSDGAGVASCALSCGADWEALFLKHALHCLACSPALHELRQRLVGHCHHEALHPLVPHQQPHLAQVQLQGQACRGQLGRRNRLFSKPPLVLPASSPTSPRCSCGQEGRKEGSWVKETGFLHPSAVCCPPAAPPHFRCSCAAVGGGRISLFGRGAA